MIPIVYEHFGLWGSEATNYFKTLSKRSKQDPTIKERDFRDFWRKRLGVLLQKCNSQVILKKMKRLTRSDEEDEEEEEEEEECRDSQYCIH